MPVYAGVDFNEVGDSHKFNGEGLLVILNTITQKKFLTMLRGRSVPVALNKYNSRALVDIGVANAGALRYYLYERTLADQEHLGVTLMKARIEFTTDNTLWKNTMIRRAGADLDLEHLRFYAYAMVHPATKSVYFDYDFQDKLLRNPMTPKAVTFNGYVMRGVENPNRTVDFYARANFPISPDEWVCGKVIENMQGISFAEAMVSKMSSQAQLKGVRVLNNVYGVDAISYSRLQLKRTHKRPSDYFTMPVDEDYFQQLLESATNGTPVQ